MSKHPLLLELLTLQERAKLPMYKGFITSEIRELKAKLWEQDLSMQEIIDVLQAKLGKFLIRFNYEVDSTPDSDYAAVGLNGGTMYADGTINIGVIYYIEEFMQGGGRMDYNDFAALLTALISHELTHREQLLSSVRNLDNLEPPDGDVKKYLGAQQEINAYAVQAALELLHAFDASEILEKLKTERGVHNLALYSEGLKWYVNFFNPDTREYKTFMKKLYELITGIED